MCLSFYCHMYGSDMGVLNVIVNGKVLISLSGDQGNKWIKKMKTISGVTGKKVVNTFFFLLCTFSGADRVPQLRKIGYLFIPRNFGRHVNCTSFTRPSTRPSAPLGNQPEISHFLASVGACNLILHIYVAVS